MHGQSPIPINITRKEAITKAKSQITEVSNILRKVQKHTRQIREKFLEDRAEHFTETQDMTKVNALQQLLRIFKQLGIWFKGKEYTMLDHMLVPDDPTNMENTTWSTVIEAQALFKVLTEDCVEHFYQAADTPFVNGRIAKKIGPFADNEYCEAILNGTFDFTNNAEITEVADLIKGMRYPNPFNPTPLIDSTIDKVGFIATIAHACEGTS
jgi:hypothetical protein